MLLKNNWICIESGVTLNAAFHKKEINYTFSLCRKKEKVSNPYDLIKELQRLTKYTVTKWKQEDEFSQKKHR